MTECNFLDKITKIFDENENLEETSIDEYTNYLYDHINSVSLEAKKAICAVLIKNDKKLHIKEHNEGLVINLELLSLEEIKNMVDILALFVNRLNK